MTQLHERKRSEASLSDEYSTQQILVTSLSSDYWLYPRLDVSATAENTKCEYYFTKEQDALNCDWLVYSYNSSLKERIPVDIWCNPPNSLTQKFIEKASEQYYKHNINILMLIPIHSIVTKRGEKYVWNDNNVEIHPVLPTPKFIYQGKQLESARNRYCVCIWRKIPSFKYNITPIITGLETTFKFSEMPPIINV